MNYNELINFLKTNDYSVCLYGARKFGRIALDNLRMEKIKPLCFIDDNQKAVGNFIDGLIVRSLADVLSGDGGGVLILITCPYYVEILKRLDSVNFPANRVVFNQSIMIDKLEDMSSHADFIRDFYENLGDNKSKKILERMILGRKEMDIRELCMLKDDRQYFPSDIFSYKDEVLLDGGAYIGDTIMSFQKFCKGNGINFVKAYAFEPDDNNYALLKENKEIYTDTEYYNCGLSNRNCVLNFHGGEGGSSVIEEDGETKIEVKAVDTMELKEIPTLIKMDIEGAELDALHGMENLIKQHKPKLAICIYHKQSDIWEIPGYIKNIVPEYKFYIRNYTNWLDEIVLYAIT